MNQAWILLVQRGREVRQLIWIFYKASGCVGDGLLQIKKVDCKKEHSRKLSYLQTL